MASACRSKADRYRERIKQDLLEAKKMKNCPEVSPVSPDTIYRRSILILKLDKDAQMKLLLEMGFEPPIFDRSEHRIFGLDTDSKVKSIELCKELKKLLAPIKDISREEMDIEEDILFDNPTAVWPTGWEDPQFLRMYCRGPSGVETAEAATDLIKKVKIEEYTEAKVIYFFLISIPLLFCGIYKDGSCRRCPS
ncbi:hypothetical protein MKX01_010183 [Papaver californicum]|nr:hypothetical protein MKX01_010183 [Papaver californicum]